MSININLLINEANLGNHLNKALQHNQRNDFAMMLAWLTPDVVEHAQFHLPTEAPVSQVDPEAQLKHDLGVYPYLKLAADNEAYNTAVNISYGLHQSGLAQAKLIGYLQNEALSQFDDCHKLDDHLIANLDLHCLRKLHQTDRQVGRFSQNESQTGVEGSILESEPSPQVQDSTQLYDILNNIN